MRKEITEDRIRVSTEPEIRAAAVMLHQALRCSVSQLAIWHLSKRPPPKRELVAALQFQSEALATFRDVFIHDKDDPVDVQANIASMDELIAHYNDAAEALSNSLIEL